MPRLLFVVLHYGSVGDTIACVATLLGQVDAETIVIDNGTPPGDATAIRAAHPGVELLRQDRNLGWAGGNNVGIRLGLERGHAAICLLNNDTLLPPDAARRLCEVLDVTGPAIVHPSIRFADAAEGMQLDPVHHTSPVTAFAPSPLMAGLYDMRSANGACMVVHREVFERIGLIDERFFLQLEEADLACRAERAGLRLYCDAHTVIVHKESAAYGARRLPLKTYYMTRNLLLLSEKNDAGMAARLARLRPLYWALANTASQGRRSGWPGFLAWLVSRDRFAQAARLGVAHYLLRRFGQASERTRTRLAADAGPTTR